jgi:hypothetical protein
MAQEREFTAEKVDSPGRFQADKPQAAMQSRIPKFAPGSRREVIAEPLRLTDKDPVLLDLIKTKFESAKGEQRKID